MVIVGGFNSRCSFARQNEESHGLEGQGEGDNPFT